MEAQERSDAGEKSPPECQKEEGLRTAHSRQWAVWPNIYYWWAERGCACWHGRRQSRGQRRLLLCVLSGGRLNGEKARVACQ